MELQQIEEKFEKIRDIMDNFEDYNFVCSELVFDYLEKRLIILSKMKKKIISKKYMMNSIKNGYLRKENIYTNSSR